MQKITVLILCTVIALVAGNTADLNPKPVTATSEIITGKESIKSSDNPEITTMQTTVKLEKDLTKTTSTTAKETTNAASPTNITTTSTTTLTPPTTPSTPKTTTGTPITTSVKPNTTTIAPKTSTVDPITTTPNSDTTPTVITTTTPLPPPVPESAGKWSVNTTNVTCIMMEMAVQFNLTIVSSNKTHVKTFNMPVTNKTTTASGVCGDTEQNITISWVDSINNNTFNSMLNIHFVKNETQNKYSLHHLESKISSYYFRDLNITKDVELVHNKTQFDISLGHSYRCMKLQEVDLVENNSTNNKTIVKGILKISDLKFQAFRKDNTTSYGLTEDCEFDTPDIVPIVVGCALAALVIVVLIAYLLGRRRREAQGYFSM